MVRRGFLQSQKGKGGGFYFEKDQAALPLKEIVRAIEGDKTYKGCSFGLKQCNADNACPLHERYAPIRNAFQQLLSDETIRSMAEKFNSKTLLS